MVGWEAALYVISFGVMIFLMSGLPDVLAKHSESKVKVAEANARAEQAKLEQMKLEQKRHQA